MQINKNNVIRGYNCLNSSELKGYLTGLIFGDARIDNGVTKRALEIASIQYDFIMKLKEDLESCTNFQCSIKFTPAHFSCGCYHRDNWTLRIAAHPYFAKKYHHFYDDYKHRVASKEALSWLTPAGLANWYMSDGYVCLVGKTKGIIRDRRVDICTDRYSLHTVQAMSDMLQNRFGLNCSIICRGKTYRIRIQKNSYQKFYDLVAPHIVPSMQYKLYLGYEQKPHWMSDQMWQHQIDLRSAITQTASAAG